MEGPPVFINGLARAGTTILMRAFYETGLFRSLTYRDLPFVLMPGIWKKISQLFSQDQEARERAHGDGIMVGFDSPEALEEIFWRTFCADDYIFDDHIKPHLVSQEVISQFRVFVRQGMISRDKPTQNRYLSKNNSNIFRLSAIRKAFPDAIIIIPFRDPIQQSISLFQQHKRFSTMQAKDSFIRDYMGWLGHFEFGATHKTFYFGNGFPMLKTEYTPANVNYWLATWINAHRYILNSAPLGSIFFSFEKLCCSPEVILTSLFSQMGFSMKANSMSEKIQAPMVKVMENIDSELKNQAMEVYCDLSARSYQP
ncbi:MAG: sulfotransferase [Nitrospina sp.]|nr:sulfotransferase [Nitrospina sp.]